MKQVIFYELENGKEPVKEWLLKLDSSTRVKVIKRLERIYDDNFGDYKQISPNLYELRFFIENEYRVILFTIDHDNLIECNEIILLNGFIKKSTKDYKKEIHKAQQILNSLI